MPSYVLYEAFASRNVGHDLWFKQMTAIGPMTTPNRDEAAVFARRIDAVRSPAFIHMLSFYEVREVETDA